MNEDLPVSATNAVKAHNWLQNNFAGDIATAVQGTQYSPQLVSAIFCQETAQRVLLWIDKYDAATILGCCVFDASGDFPNTTRNAFPKNAVAFHDKYGDEFTDMLIAEANKMRKMPQPGKPQGYDDSHYLYKGYGLFQYDLQAVLTDEAFFRNKLWYSFTECLSRLISELNTKAKQSGSLRDTVRRYNGAGQNAENYADNVMEFVEIVGAV